jgi:8-oxo-dGTP pyrophosphatase MutT (NUDIX family)
MRENQVALVHDVFGYWTLPKGKIEPTENYEEAACREVKEELGIQDLVLERKLCENEYIAHDPEVGPVRRRVVYFLGKTSDKELHLETSGGLIEAQWFPRNEIKNLKMYEDIRRIFDLL